MRVGRGGGSRYDESVGEWLLGLVARGQERHGHARAHLETSRSLSIDPQLPLPLGRSLLGLAELASRDGDLDQACELAHDGLEVLDDYRDRVGTAAALDTIADVAVALDEPERSMRLLAASQRFHTDTGRGLSGDHPDLRLDRIVEDVVTYVESIGEPAGLTGWSSGGSWALIAAAQSDAVSGVAPSSPGSSARWTSRTRRSSVAS